jgi:flagellar biosynthetic protein FliQ
MNEIEVIDIAREGLYILIIIAAPVMAVALGVGLLIALFQALTQIQEMTLTFVPKIIAVFFSLMIFMPFMFNTLDKFTESMFERITLIGESDREMNE